MVKRPYTFEVVSTGSGVRWHLIRWTGLPLWMLNQPKSRTPLLNANHKLLNRHRARVAYHSDHQTHPTSINPICRMHSRGTRMPIGRTPFLIPSRVFLDKPQHTMEAGRVVMSSVRHSRERKVSPHTASKCVLSNPQDLLGEKSEAPMLTCRHNHHLLHMCLCRIRTSRLPWSRT